MKDKNIELSARLVQVVNQLESTAPELHQILDLLSPDVESQQAIGGAIIDLLCYVGNLKNRVNKYKKAINEQKQLDK